MALSFIVMIYAVNLAMVSAPVGMQWLLITYAIQTWGELALSPNWFISFFTLWSQEIHGANVWFMVPGQCNWRSNGWTAWWRGIRWRVGNHISSL